MPQFLWKKQKQSQCCTLSVYPSSISTRAAHSFCLNQRRRKKNYNNKKQMISVLIENFASNHANCSQQLNGIQQRWSREKLWFWYIVWERRDNNNSIKASSLILFALLFAPFSSTPLLKNSTVSVHMCNAFVGVLNKKKTAFPQFLHQNTAWKNLEVVKKKKKRITERRWKREFCIFSGPAKVVYATMSLMSL